MAGGLAADRGPRFCHQARDVAVPDGRPVKSDAFPGERELQPVVGHDGSDDASRGQTAPTLPVPGQNPEDVVAV